MKMIKTAHGYIKEEDLIRVEVRKERGNFEGYMVYRFGDKETEDLLASAEVWGDPNKAQWYLRRLTLDDSLASIETFELGKEEPEAMRRARIIRERLEVIAKARPAMVERDDRGISSFTLPMSDVVVRVATGDFHASAEEITAVIRYFFGSIETDGTNVRFRVD